MNEIKCQVDFLHEFTDGCSAQYKFRHCMGSHVLMSKKDVGYCMQRNYFETSHTKGEQDAAGAHIKQRAAVAVIRNEATIHSGADLFQLVFTNFSDPAGEKVELKRRKSFMLIQKKL